MIRFWRFAGGSNPPPTDLLRLRRPGTYDCGVLGDDGGDVGFGASIGAALGAAFGAAFGEAFIAAFGATFGDFLFGKTLLGVTFFG